MKTLHVFTLMCTARFFDGQFKYLCDNGHEMHLACCPDQDMGVVERNGLSYHPVEIARRIDIKTDLKSIFQLAKLIRKEKYDAVFGHTPKGSMVAMIASALAGVKIRVYYRHGLIYTTASGLKRFIFKTVERLTGWLATDVVNVSPSLSALAAKDHLNSAKRQYVIGSGTCSGIDTQNKFNPALVTDERKAELRKKLGIEDDELVFGFVGRICKEKGVREMIDAFEEFDAKHPEVKAKLLMVGGYDTRDILPDEYKAKIAGLPGIIDTGKVDNAKIADYYSVMDVFIFPSYREGIGMSVLEASAMEVPILVSRSHGCVDSIRENETGLYIDISKDGILEGMEKMMDPDLRKKLGKGGRKLVETEFEMQDYWKKVLDFYKNL